MVFYDNMSTVALAHNPILHSKTKHMELDLFFVREKFMDCLQVIHVPDVDQYDNILTEFVFFLFAEFSCITLMNLKKAP